jgi:sensor histidine kinase YesM
MNKLIFENTFKFRFARHFIFFVLTVWAFALIFYVQNRTGNFLETFSITAINALFFFGYAYITIFLLIPEYLINRKILLFVLLFFLVGIGFSALKLVVSDHIFYSSISPENIQRSGIMNLRFIIVNTKDMTFIVALFCIIKYAKDYIFAEQIQKKLEIQSKIAQSKLLQAQFDPHFLFNTINNLYALSLLHPLKTLEVIKRIKTVLKYIINESQKQFVGLQEEIELVENYIALEKLRYGNRLKMEFDQKGETGEMQIPPMILFFLVENCFKHGSSLDAGTPWIKIRVIVKNRTAFLITENSMPGSLLKKQVKENGGHGFKNIRKRLGMIYPTDGFQLDISRQNNVFKVVLKLKTIEIENSIEKYRMA